MLIVLYKLSVNKDLLAKVRVTGLSQNVKKC
jgi:hypothetical protein